METIEHSTGRDYGMPQVLRISVESKKADDMGFCDVVARFDDASRGISGRVSVVVFGSDSIGAAVLAAYDAGRYELI